MIKLKRNCSKLRDVHITCRVLCLCYPVHNGEWLGDLGVQLIGESHTDLLRMSRLGDRGPFRDRTITFNFVVEFLRYISSSC